MNLKKLIISAATMSAWSLTAATHEADVIIYGGTSASVTAAVRVKKMGKSVNVVSPDRRIGGLSSGGLGWTDTGDKTVIGGLSRNFYHRIYRHYQEPDAWKFQEQSEYGGKGQGNPATDHGERTMWIFEPGAALKVFEGYISEYKIPLHREAYLDREDGVKMEDGKIVSITTLDGDTFSGKTFFDTTYEGDLMAAAGVTYTVAREGKETYVSPQLYIREARRMVGDFVMTEHELLRKKPTPDSIGMGSYTIDSHNTQRYISEDGRVHNEGDIGVNVKPYEISYGSLVPKKEECENLLVTCAVSASHVAYGSIRMEPVFMILGQSAATAAVMALDGDVAVQDISYEELQERLVKNGQVLAYEGRIK